MSAVNYQQITCYHGMRAERKGAEGTALGSLSAVRRAAAERLCDVARGGMRVVADDAIRYTASSIGGDLCGVSIAG